MSSRLLLLLLLPIIGWAQSPAPEPVPAGGWTLDERAASLRYQPTRHADRFAKAWLEFASEVKATRRGDMVKKLQSPDAAGRCLNCHQVTENGVRWESQALATSVMDRFSHLPHLQLGAVSEKSCAACHQLKTEKEKGLAGSFLPLNRAACASCHKPGTTGARASCTTCHSYHRHDFAPNPAVSRLLGR